MVTVLNQQMDREVLNRRNTWMLIATAHFSALLFGSVKFSVFSSMNVYNVYRSRLLAQ